MFKKIAIHNGVFHADDVVSVALIKELYGEDIILERVSFRDKETQGSLVARGFTFIDIGEGQFDHHQLEHKTDEYKYACNGILKSALGLVLDQCVADGKLTEEEVRYMLNKGLYSLQAKDNGQDISMDTFMVSPFEYIVWLNSEDIYSGEQEVMCREAIAMSQKIIRGMINGARKSIQEHEECIAAFKAAENGVANFPCHMTNGITECQQWNEEHPEHKIVFYTFPGGEGGYMIRAVNKPGKKEVMQPLRFCGLRNEELNEAAGIDDGIFVHASGFLGSAGSLENCYGLI